MNSLHKTAEGIGPDMQPRVTGETLRQWMVLFAASVRAAEGTLTELDAAIGDGDHGSNMRRGMDAVEQKLDAQHPADLSGQMRIISTTLMSSIGGASGPLYGAFFLQASHAAQHKSNLGLVDVTAALEGGLRGVMQLGKAAVGDKTMVDALAAAVASLRHSCNRHEPLADALKAASNAARLASEGTIPMVARKGRASYLGERSAGTEDPGAASASLLFASLAQAVSETGTSTGSP